MPHFLLPSTYLNQGWAWKTEHDPWPLTCYVEQSAKQAQGCIYLFACMSGMGAAKMALHMVAEVGSSSQRAFS